jgi:hypothetical protein
MLQVTVIPTLVCTESVMTGVNQRVPTGASLHQACFDAGSVLHSRIQLQHHMQQLLPAADQPANCAYWRNAHTMLCTARRMLCREQRPTGEQVCLPLINV